VRVSDLWADYETRNRRANEEYRRAPITSRGVLPVLVPPGDPAAGSPFSIPHMRIGHRAWWGGDRSDEVQELERAYNAWRYRVRRAAKRQVLCEQVAS
jgi:hypothetical protein